MFCFTLGKRIIFSNMVLYPLLELNIYSAMGT
uniref:Uncharacterized protein n=1 Tax=Rhizophora mucronata TaxID=61149 RepID=A0A2P2Q9R4_RHIMU